MSLVAGRGPLSKDPAGWFSPPLPDDLVFVEPHPRRVQAIRNGQTGDRHRAGADGAPARSSAQLRISGRRRRRPTQRAGAARHRATSMCPGMRSTRGSRKDADSSTTRRIRTTASTAARPTAGCGSASPAPRWSTPSTRSIVFETALEPRLYVDPSVGPHRPVAAHGRRRSYCNYKGYATYWAAVIGDTVVDDVAWSYEDPPPETPSHQGTSQL